MERGKVLREDLFQEIVFKHKPKSNDRASYLRPCSKLLITSSWPASQAEFRIFYEMLQSFLMPQPNSVVLPDFPVLCLAMWSSFFFWNLLPHPVPLFQCYIPSLISELTTSRKALFSLSGPTTDSLGFSVLLKQSQFSFLTMPLPRSHSLHGFKISVNPKFIFPVPFLS